MTGPAEVEVARLGTADDPLTDDALAFDLRVYQRTKGHRYSLDDLLTAEVAHRACGPATTHADLGCGLGSVLLVVAARSPAGQHLGVEAQAVSFELARRNVARNGLEARVTLVHGDLREVSTRPEYARAFALVTGTPPYIPPGHSTPAPDAQKAYARIEYRGGVEAYVEAMARLLTDEGTGVLCGDAKAGPRIAAACARSGLRVHARLDAIPRAGAAALFGVYTLRRSPCGEPAHGAFVARDAEGRRSPAYLALRSALGLPPAFDPHAG